VELLDLGAPFASEPNVVAYDRHILLASDDPADVTRHRAPCPIGTTRIEKAFVHEMPKQLVGSVFAQADLFANACDLGIGIYLVPSAHALVDSPEHRFALIVSKFCRHYAPLPLVPPPIVRLPDRTATRPARDAALARLRLLAGLAAHTSNHTSRRRAIYPELEEEALGDVFQRFSTAPHLVWGRVVPDIPDFCRELVAALAEE